MTDWPLQPNRGRGKMDNQPDHWESHTYICLKLQWENKIWTTSKSLRCLWLQPLHSVKLTWPLKIGHPKRTLVFQASIFRSYVSFMEGNTFWAAKNEEVITGHLLWLGRSNLSSGLGNKDRNFLKCHECSHHIPHLLQLDGMVSIINQLEKTTWIQMTAHKPRKEQATSCKNDVHVWTLQSLRILLSQVHTRKVRTSDSAFRQCRMGQYGTELRCALCDTSLDGKNANTRAKP